jgi:hypothetical protein
MGIRMERRAVTGSGTGWNGEKHQLDGLDCTRGIMLTRGPRHLLRPTAVLDHGPPRRQLAATAQPIG